MKLLLDYGFNEDHPLPDPKSLEQLLSDTVDHVCAHKTVLAFVQQICS
jgi:hypothetical protein